MKLKVKVVVFVVFVFTACECPRENQLKVSNKADFDRNEVVSIERVELESILKGKDIEKVMIFDMQKSQYLVTQLLDNDMDGKVDELLFQANVKANSTSNYKIECEENAEALRPEAKVTTYSRFVPERSDDYAWENDKVAFRVYGPEAERLVHGGKPGGSTLSSGIDLWLKRVDYSIIDKWYSNCHKAGGSYHVDHGEGYDPYHVGASRGTGGTGIWKDDSLFVSNNFVAYRTICKGPLRTIFELDYAPWSPFHTAETKRISLDLGTNFSKFEISIAGDFPENAYTTGITLHEGKGEINIDSNDGTFMHWERIDEEYVGEGLVLDPRLVADAFCTSSKVPDQNQLLVTTKAKSKLVYYAGFVWTKSKQVKSKEDWENLLKQQAEILANPLIVSVE